MIRTLFAKTGGWPGTLTLLATLLLLVGIAKAEPTITWLGNNFPWDCSADGTVVVGNVGDGSYETFRWTTDSGVVRLGMCSACVLGTGGGTPNVSDDGDHVSATILGADSTYVTLGLWSKGIGWQEAIPPVPADGGLLDVSYGSCWGISGNGDVIVGFFWRPGQATTGLAHAATWSATSGFTELAPVIRSSRANSANYDGSVVVGWSETSFGNWQPTVWEDGGYTLLYEGEAWAEAGGVSNDGNIIVGNAYDPLTNQVAATAWLRTSTGWQQQILGVLPGTFPGSGSAIAYSVSSNGDVIVGFNDFGNQTGAGFVWTLQEGLMSANDYITGLGLTLPTNFVVDNVTAVSNNGRVIVGKETYTDKIIICSGDVIITPNSTLEFTRVFMGMSCNSNGQYRIQVTLLRPVALAQDLGVLGHGGGQAKHR